MGTSTSRRAKIRGSRRSSCRTRPIPITTGTSASPPSATRPTRVAHPRRRRPHRADRQQLLRGSASTSARRCCPGWKDTAPDVYAAILEADRRERSERFSGHGSAMAQAYNHMIMPLANRARQGHAGALGHPRFRASASAASRRACGCPKRRWTWRRWKCWPSTASSSPSWRPHQAQHDAPHRAAHWQERRRRHDRSDAALHLQAAVRTNASSLFFYDGPISRAVAFERLLNNGETLRQPAAGRLFRQRDWPQLVHIATDGETYGHHHRHGDMALAYALASHRVQQPREAHQLRRVSGEASADPRGRDHREHRLELRPRRRALAQRLRLQLRRGTGWNQDWREPLRDALDWLRDELAPLFEEQGRELLNDPWARATITSTSCSIARRKAWTPSSQRHRSHELERTRSRVALLKLLEMQRHAMLMYTSCGWFFDELSGHRNRAGASSMRPGSVQLAQELFGDRLEKQFLERLDRRRRATSRIPQRPGSL